MDKVGKSGFGAKAHALRTFARACSSRSNEVSTAAIAAILAKSGPGGGIDCGCDILGSGIDMGIEMGIDTGIDMGIDGGIGGGIGGGI